MATQRAGLFDIRNMIGSLLTVYGVILTLMGLEIPAAMTGEVLVDLVDAPASVAFSAAWSAPVLAPM